MRSRTVALLAAVALVVGSAVSFVADALLFSYDDSCPQWEDEGPMAAPHSPYSRVMCAPADPPFVWGWLIGVVVALALAVWVVRRHGVRPGRAWPWLALVLVAPSLLVGLLHVTLPRDCLTGESPSGDCTRDRELR